MPANLPTHYSVGGSCGLNDQTYIFDEALPAHNWQVPISCHFWIDTPRISVNNPKVKPRKYIILLQLKSLIINWTIK